MKPAVDEMFPEGAGPYVDLDEVGLRQRRAGHGGGSTARKRAGELTPLGIRKLRAAGERVVTVAGPESVLAEFQRGSGVCS
ncbi:hypothetical protein STEG23_014980 [Scotinomys teguina]